ncbi:hypothetical protein BH09ACT4_BH09ACT4_08030 [soil metagenome]
MTTGNKIALRALEAVAAGVILFALMLAFGAANPQLTYVPLGIGAVYFIAQVVRMRATKK